MKSRFLVVVKAPTEVEIEWLLIPSEEEKTIVERAMSDKMNQVWDTITVPNPTLYINLSLYFDGHLDSNHMLPRISNVLQVLLKTIEELADIFKTLGQESKPKIRGDFKMVVVNPNQKDDTLIEEGEIEQSPPQGAAVPLKIVSTVKVTVHDDTESRMSSIVIDSLQVDKRCKRELLQKEDMHKYAGDEKFNPKSFKSSSSVVCILIWTGSLLSKIHPNKNSQRTNVGCCSFGKV